MCRYIYTSHVYRPVTSDNVLVSTQFFMQNNIATIIILITLLFTIRICIVLAMPSYLKYKYNNYVMLCSGISLPVTFTII